MALLAEIRRNHKILGGFKIDYKYGGEIQSFTKLYNHDWESKHTNWRETTNINISIFPFLTERKTEKVPKFLIWEPLV